MRKLGFWTGDGDRHQRNAINEAVDELDNLQSSSIWAMRQIDGLRATVQAQAAEIKQLQAALQAVCDLIVDLDLVEETALSYRIDAALETSAAPASGADPESGPVSPFAPAPRAPAPKLRTEVTCAVCQRSVAARDITFTDGGPTCSRCIAIPGTT